MTTIEKLENLRERLKAARDAWVEELNKYCDEHPEMSEAEEAEYDRRLACWKIVDGAYRRVCWTLDDLRACGLEIDDDDD